MVRGSQGGDREGKSEEAAEINCKYTDDSRSHPVCTFHLINKNVCATRNKKPLASFSGVCFNFEGYIKCFCLIFLHL